MYIFDETFTNAFLLDSSSTHQVGILHLAIKQVMVFKTLY